MLRSFQEVLPPDRLEDDSEHFAFFQGKIRPLKEAKVSIMTQSFLFGTAVHEGLRGYCNSAQDEVFLFRLREHYERMERNGKILKIELPYSVDELCEQTINLIRANSFRDDCYVRAIAYKSGLQIGLQLADMNDFTMFALRQGRFQADERRASLCVSSWRRVEDNAVPPRAKINGAYVNSALALTEARDNGFDDAIVLNENGHVSEGSGMNIVLVKNNRLIMPSVSDNILEGITRETLMDLARNELGLEIVERTVDRTELYTADEVFLCGTGVEVIPVKAIDRRAIGKNNATPVTDRLRNLYSEVVRGERASYAHWLTSVYNADSKSRIATVVN